MSLFSLISKQKVLGLSVLGAAAGTILAVATAPQPLSARGPCKCDDWGTGMHQCNYDQNACITGSEHCEVVCSED